jgi:hypothetical protein
MDFNTRKEQFYGFALILLIIGVLNYFRKLTTGYKLTYVGKILYLCTMVIFTVGIMFVLYFTELNNIISFLIGLFITTMSEHISNLIINIGVNFEKIAVKIIHKYTKIDLSKELITKTEENNNNNKNKEENNQENNQENISENNEHQQID